MDFIKTDVQPVVKEIFGYKNISFSILFVCQLTVVICLALSYGLIALTHKNPIYVEVDVEGIHNQYKDKDSVKLLGGILSIICVVGFLSIAWVQIVALFASQLVLITLGAVVLVNVVGGIGMFTSGHYAVGSTLFALSLCFILFFVYIRPRLEFVAVNLKVGCTALLSMPTLIMYAIGILFIQIIWCAIWSIAAFGVATNEAITTLTKNGHTYKLAECASYSFVDELYVDNLSIDCWKTSTTCEVCICDGTLVKNSNCFTPTINGGKYFALLICLYWTCATFANILHCTTAGAVSDWWKCGVSSIPAVQKNFWKSITSNLGPICLGSLLVALIRTARTAVNCTIRFTKGNEGDGSTPMQKFMVVYMRIMKSLLELLDRVVQYFNHYAFCYVAIYNYDFVEASKSVLELFQTKGLATVINDNIIDNALTISHFIIGTVGLIVGYLYGLAVNMNSSTNVTFLSLMGFFCGYLMCTLTLNIISSAVSTVYICFMENPQELKKHNPALFIELMTAWQEIFPRNRIGDEEHHKLYEPPNLGPHEENESHVKQSVKNAIAEYSKLPQADDSEAGGLLLSSVNLDDSTSSEYKL